MAGLEVSDVWLEVAVLLVVEVVELVVVELVVVGPVVVVPVMMELATLDPPGARTLASPELGDEGVVGVLAVTGVEELAELPGEELLEPCRPLETMPPPLEVNAPELAEPGS